MALIISFLLIVVGFALLIKGADYLVAGASSLAKKANVSELAIGLTVVALGTSAPELVVTLLSSFNGSDGSNEMAFGSIIGSNIFNLLLILGVAGIIYPLSVQKSLIWKEIPFSLGITLLLFVMLNDQMFFGKDYNSINQWEGLVLVILFVCFLVYVLINSRNSIEEIEVEEVKAFSNSKNALFIAGGMVGLVLGGKLVVDNAIEVANHFQVSKKLIGLTIVAAGTSLPELATSAVAAYKKRSDIALGNVIGSNIFNILFVLALSSVIKPINYDTSFNIDLYVIMGATVLLFTFMFTLGRKKLDRWEAVLFVLGFVAYTVFLFIRK